MSNNKIIFSIVFFLSTIMFLQAKQMNDSSSINKIKIINIAINQFIEHPNLDQVIEGFQDTLANWEQNNSYKINYKIQNASKDMKTMLGITQSIHRNKYNLVLSLTTPAAQATVKGVQNKPIIFAAITDPIHAGLVKSFNEPHDKNITGVTDSAPYKVQFKLFREAFPNSKTIGVLHNPGEANSEASMKMIRKVAKDNSFNLKEIPVSNTNDVILATKVLVKNIDLLYLPADNTVVSSIAAIAKIAKVKKIPLLASDEGSIKNGALFTLGVNYYSSGVEAAKKAIRILEGTYASKIDVTQSSSSRLIVNLKSFQEYDMFIPKALHKYLDKTVYYK